MIVVKLEEQMLKDSVAVKFSIGETEGNAFSFAVETAGVLTMSPGQWSHLKSALQKGARRPLVLLSEKADA